MLSHNSAFKECGNLNSNCLYVFETSFKGKTQKPNKFEIFLINAQVISYRFKQKEGDSRNQLARELACTKT